MHLKYFQKLIAVIILVAFACSSVHAPAYAEDSAMPWMPKPGAMVGLSPEFTPAYLRGIVIHPENALKFDFIIYKGDKPLSDAQKYKEYGKLIKYFMASLAVPDEDQWVNLSPYEKDRIIKDDFGRTEMGRDLLAQDYLLKQITASLIYPESKLGKDFWSKVYARAERQYGTSNIPVNTFNKVWILPDNAEIYEKGNTAFILKNHLRVMLEGDYLALEKNKQVNNRSTSDLGSQIVRQIIIPEMEKEINEDENFAPVRQIYSGMLLAAWYKRALKDSLLSRIYVNKSRLKGVDQDPRINEIIYQRYLQAYKKGVFNFIKEDVDKYTHLMIPRKYFSGGMIGYNADFAQLVHRYKNIDHTRLSKLEGEKAAFDSVQVEEQEVTAHDAAMKIFPKRISAVILRAVLVGFLAGASPVLADENMNEHRFVAPYMLTQNQIDYLKPGINSMAAYLKDVDHAKRDLPALEEYLIGLATGLTQNLLPEDGAKSREDALVRYIENLAGPNNSTNEDIEKIKDMLINMLRHGYYEQIFGPHRIVPRTNSFPPTSSNGYYIPSNLSGIARVTAILYLRHRDDGLFNNFSNEFSELLSRPEGLIGLEVRGIISDALNNNQKKSSAQPIQQEIVRLESKAKNQKRSHKDFPNLPLAAPAGMPLDLGNRTGSPMEIHPPPAAPAIVPLNSGGRAGHYQGKGVFSDGAQFSNDPTNNPGGIDFNAAHLDLQIKRDGNGIALPLAQQDLDNIYIEGLIPVILSIKPVQSSLEFLN